MRNARLLVVFFALLLLLAACGGKSAEEELLEQIIESGGEDIGDIDISSDGDDFSINVQGDDGEDVSISGNDDDFTITVEGDDGETMTFGGGEIPDGLQLPVPPGGEVQSSIAGGNEMLVALQYADGDYDELVAFYDSELDADSDAVEKTETSFTTEDGTFRNAYYGPTDGGDWTVTVGDCIGFPGVCVNLIQGSP